MKNLLAYYKGDGKQLAWLVSDFALFASVMETNRMIRNI